MVIRSIQVFVVFITLVMPVARATQSTGTPASMTVINCQFVLQDKDINKLRLPLAANPLAQATPGHFGFALGLSPQGQVSVLIPQDIFPLLTYTGVQDFTALVSVLKNLGGVLSVSLNMTHEQYNAALNEVLTNFSSFLPAVAIQITSPAIVGIEKLDANGLRVIVHDQTDLIRRFFVAIKDGINETEFAKKVQSLNLQGLKMDHVPGSTIYTAQGNRSNIIALLALDEVKALRMSSQLRPTGRR